MRTVRVVLFATAREAAGGRSELIREVPAEGIPLNELLRALVEEFPRIGPVLPHCRFARNARYVGSPRVVLRPGDELAVHPPYSGG